MSAGTTGVSMSSVRTGYWYTTSHYCDYSCESLVGGRESSRMALRARLMIESVTVFIAGALQCSRVVDEEVFQRNMKYAGYKEVYEACLPYMERRD